MKKQVRSIAGLGVIILGLILMAVGFMPLIIVEPIGYVQTYTASNGQLFEIWEGYNHNGQLRYYVVGHPDVEFSPNYMGIEEAKQACENWIHGGDPGGGGEAGIIFKVRNTNTGDTVADATVIYISTKTTNSLGEAYYTSVPTDSVLYKVTKSGFYDSSGYATGVLGSTNTIIVNLTPVGGPIPTGKVLTIQSCAPSGKGEVTLTPLPNGKTQPLSGGGSYAYSSGTPVSLMATAVTGYVLDAWSVQTSNGATPNYYTLNPLTLTMTEDTVVYALFKGGDSDVTQYLLAVESAHPSGKGSVKLSPTPISGNQPGKGASDCYYSADTEVSASATPVSGYSFDYWTISTAAYSSTSDDNPLRIALSADTVIRAFFRSVSDPIPTGKRLIIDVLAGGSVTVTPTGINEPGTDVYEYETGTKVTLKFNAYSGYVLTKVVITPSGGTPFTITSTTYTLTMGTDYIVTPIFMKDSVIPPISTKTLLMGAGGVLVILGVAILAYRRR